MKAGAVVTATKSLFHTLSDNPDIVETFSTISRSLVEMNLQRIGMALSIVKLDGHTLSVSSAGVPPLLLFRAETGTVEEILLEGMPLGYSTQALYQLTVRKLFPGDAVLMMSDGLPERHNTAGEDLGSSRTESHFRKAVAKSPAEICRLLAQGGEEWAGGRPRDDDVTFVVLKVKV